MAASTNHFKLGMFVILSFGAMVTAGVALGSHAIKRDTTKYHTYFNESVQGLDVGSPVKFRGVTIGAVSAIEIAPDHREVDVVSFRQELMQVAKFSRLIGTAAEQCRCPFRITPEHFKARRGLRWC